LKIRGLSEAQRLTGVIVFHAGTRQAGTDILSDGGRVLTITGLGFTASEAKERAYAAVDLIDLPGALYRRDIGWRATGLKRLS
jgi:phosphoribosylamine--glycine ligase